MTPEPDPDSDPGPIPPPAHAAEIRQPDSAWTSLRRAWGFRPYFLALLPVAVLILVLAIAEAQLMISSAAAGQEIFAGLTAREEAAKAVTSGGGGAEVGKSAGPDGTMGGSEAPQNRLLQFVFMLWPGEISGQAIFEVALIMALLLFLGKALSVCADQMRMGLNLRFRSNVQRDLLDGLCRETANTRTMREAGSTSLPFNSDAGELGTTLIFGLLGALENVIKLGSYAIALSMFPKGWIIFSVFAAAHFLFGALITRLFLNREKQIIETEQHMMERTHAESVSFFDLVGRLVSLGGERSEAERILSNSVEQGRNNQRFHLVSTIRHEISTVMSTLSWPLVVIVSLAAYAYSADGLFQIGLLLGMVGGHISGLISIPAMLVQSGPAMRRVQTILEIPQLAPRPPALDSLLAAPDPPAITLEGVTFSYRGAAKPVLEDLDIEIPSGKTVGIVGQSGCGKSTLARLILGDHCVDRGRVLIGGVDATDWHLAYRREIIAYLPDEPGFLRGTLEDNLYFGRDRGALGSVEAALADSGAQRVVDKKADEGGLQCMIENANQQLSGGQRRMVGIARILLGHQKILVFDEPGAQLSPDVMLDVAGGIGRAVIGKTALIITHDPDVFHTDFNIFLAGGKVADVGTHEDLKASNEDYFNLMEKNVEARAERNQQGAAGGQSAIDDSL